MSEGKYFKFAIVIDVEPKIVWEALTNPLFTKIYMFGCEVVSSWKLWEPVEWKGAEDGIIYVKGILLDYVKEKKLAYTVFDPNAGYKDIPENYLTTSYELEASADNKTILSVSQGDFSKVENGEKRYKDSVGWKMVLKGLKQMLETKVDEKDLKENLDQE